MLFFRPDNEQVPQGFSLGFLSPISNRGFSPWGMLSSNHPPPCPSSASISPPTSAAWPTSPPTRLTLDVPHPATIATTLDALEARYPMLRNTIRDHITKQRRPFLRFFVCNEDWTHLPTNTLLPEAILNATEPLIILGAIAGG